jgi:hypothetical protein
MDSLIIVVFAESLHVGSRCCGGVMCGLMDWEKLWQSLVCLILLYVEVCYGDV